MSYNKTFKMGLRDIDLIETLSFLETFKTAIL